MWLLRPLPLMAIVVAVCLGIAGIATWHRDQETVRSTGSAQVRPASDRTSHAVEVLDAWDRSRAAAYSSGDVEALRRLYVPGAPAGRSDVRILRQYAARGLAVRELTLERSELEVVALTDRLLRVETLEGVARATVAAGERETTLPRDGPERREITLVRADGGWQVASVVPAGVGGEVTGAGRPGSGP